MTVMFFILFRQVYKILVEYELNVELWILLFIFYYIILFIIFKVLKTLTCVVKNASS